MVIRRRICCSLVIITRKEEKKKTRKVAGEKGRRTEKKVLGGLRSSLQWGGREEELRLWEREAGNHETPAATIGSHWRRGCSER